MTQLPLINPAHFFVAAAHTTWFQSIPSPERAVRLFVSAARLGCRYRPCPDRTCRHDVFLATARGERHLPDLDSYTVFVLAHRAGARFEAAWFEHFGVHERALNSGLSLCPDRVAWADREIGATELEFGYQSATPLLTDALRAELHQMRCRFDEITAQVSPERGLMRTRANATFGPAPGCRPARAARTPRRAIGKARSPPSSKRA